VLKRDVKLQLTNWHGGIGLYLGHIVLDREPAPLPKGHTPQFLTHVLLWPNNWFSDATWYGGTVVCLGPGDVVLDGTHLPPPQKKGVSTTTFRPMCCGQTAGWIKMPLGTDLGLGPGHIVLDRDPAPPSTKGAEPHQFSAHLCCDQPAGLIKTPLGTEIVLGPGDIVLNGDPSPLKKGTPNFRSICLLWPNGRPSQLLLSTCNSNVTNNGSLSNTIAWTEAFFRTK